MIVNARCPIETRLTQEFDERAVLARNWSWVRSEPLSECRVVRTEQSRLAPINRSTESSQSGRLTRNGSLLIVQFPLESLLGLRDVTFISGRIDKDTRAVLRVMLKLTEHIEVSTVGS
jgi:hypothetical protein